MGVLQGGNERREVLEVALNQFDKGEFASDLFSLGVPLAFDESLDLVSLVVKDGCQVLAVLSSDAGD